MQPNPYLPTYPPTHPPTKPKPPIHPSIPQHLISCNIRHYNFVYSLHSSLCITSIHITSHPLNPAPSLSLLISHFSLFPHYYSLFDRQVSQRNIKNTSGQILPPKTISLPKTSTSPLLPVLLLSKTQRSPVTGSSSFI